LKALHHVLASSAETKRGQHGDNRTTWGQPAPPYQVHDVDGARVVGRGLRVEHRPVEVDGDELPRRSPGKYLDVAAQVKIESNIEAKMKAVYNILVSSFQFQAFSKRFHRFNLHRPTLRLISHPPCTVALAS